MKIAIISDSHDNLPNLKKAVDWIKKEKIKIIIHCGDVSNQEIFKEALGDYKGKIYLSRGNCDLGDFDIIPRLKIYDEFGEVSVRNKKVAFTHFPKIAGELAMKEKYDLVFYGHNHKPWVKTVGKTQLVNPGNLSGVFYKATFATYDNRADKLELKILERL
ncbi:MAG: YfcE family phosphodiesterase [Candidatus Pacebacteria bacterium]|nr:YfcE family phosphodiesterase [Candidatus Paceibacterota bacterium]